MNRFGSGVILIIISACFSSCFMQRTLSGKRANHNDTTEPARADTNMAPGLTRHDTVKFTPPVDTGKLSVIHADSNAINNSNAKSSANSAKDLIGRLEPLWKNRLVYNTFSGKAKVKFDGPDNKQEFTANFRIRKDSIIWINVVALGLPVARILITPDSLYMINYLQEEVTMRSLSDAAKILPAKMDFSSIQNLLTGEPFRDGEITRADTGGNIWALQVEDTSYIQHVTYNKTDSSIQTTKLLTRKPNGPEATETYSNYEPTAKGKISTARELTIKNGTDDYLLKINIMKVEFDEPVDFPFTIPRNYSVK